MTPAALTPVCPCLLQVVASFDLGCGGCMCGLFWRIPMRLLCVTSLEVQELLTVSLDMRAAAVSMVSAARWLAVVRKTTAGSFPTHDDATQVDRLGVTTIAGFCKMALFFFSNACPRLRFALFMTAGSARWACSP